MRHVLVALGLAASGCSLYFDGPDEPEPQPQPDPDPDPEPPQRPHYVIARGMVGEAPIVGMDVDREGGAWVAYRREVGGFYDNDIVRVVHLDETGTKVAEFTYDDEYTAVSGLAFSGDALWLNYNDQVSNNHIRKIDPVTGATLANIGTEPGIVDLDVHGDELRLSSLWNEIIALDLDTGVQQWRKSFEYDGFFYSTQRGIASDTDGNVWTTSWNSNALFLFSPSAGVISDEATTDVTHQTVANGQQLFLAFDEIANQDMIVFAVESQIFWVYRSETAHP